MVMKKWLKKAQVFGNLVVIQAKFEERSRKNQAFLRFKKIGKII